MPYDHAEIARQIAESQARAEAALTARGDAARDAAEIYGATSDAEWEAAVVAAQSSRFMAVPHTPLHEVTGAAPAGPDYTVVATDSSFVAPDKHRGAYCYLINVGRVMVQYGEDSAAELDSAAAHCADPLVEGEDWLVSGPVLQAQCAVRELQELHAWAGRFGADLAFVDGSLMQLGLAFSRIDEVKRQLGTYAELLDDFARMGVPVVGYVSRPASQAVTHGTRLRGCRSVAETGAAPCDHRCLRPECSGLWTVDDGDLFWELLPPGTRSPVFEPRWNAGGLARAAFWEEMGFCYLATPYEVARLEFPLWVADSGALDRVQSIALSQCLLGEGYPRVLTLAHNFAVLRAEDRESYFFLLERAGLIQPPSEKARGKRATGGHI